MLETKSIGSNFNAHRNVKNYTGHFLLRQHPIPNWNGTSEVTDLECSASLCKVFQIGHMWGPVFDHLQKTKADAGLQLSNSVFYFYFILVAEEQCNERRGVNACPLSTAGGAVWRRHMLTQAACHRDTLSPVCSTADGRLSWVPD